VSEATQNIVNRADNLWYDLHKLELRVRELRTDLLILIGKIEDRDEGVDDKREEIE
jgi:hypothetical protein